MHAAAGWARRIFPSRGRLLGYLLAALAILAWDVWRHDWRPQVEIGTAHFRIHSSATEEQTRAMGQRVEKLYAAYVEMFPDVVAATNRAGKFEMKMFKDREEFRWCNRVRDWAEAFYRPPYSHFYWSEKEVNPYHWMLHEVVHQLNHELGYFQLAKWLDEGVAEYFSTSFLGADRLKLGVIDVNTYPVWWSDKLATSGQREADVANGSFIPLRTIITGKGGPDMDEAFNLYYLHWWSLAHYLFEFDKGQHRDGCRQLMREGGSLAGFEKLIGPLERIEPEWYQHIQRLKRSVANERETGAK